MAARPASWSSWCAVLSSLPWILSTVALLVIVVIQRSLYHFRLCPIRLWRRSSWRPYRLGWPRYSSIQFEKVFGILFVHGVLSWVVKYMMGTSTEYGGLRSNLLRRCWNEFILTNWSYLRLSCNRWLSLSLHHCVKIAIRLNLMVPQFQSSFILCEYDSPFCNLPSKLLQFVLLLSFFDCHCRLQIRMILQVFSILKYKWHFLSLLVHGVLGAEESAFLSLGCYVHRWRCLLFEFDHVWWFFICEVKLQELLWLVIYFTLSYFRSTFVIRIQALLQSRVFLAYCL